ncbi:MAG: hypothetical protein IJD86_05955 [Clostridia bacterium]|nr:hypothetical protein [Clostridia bacterium]
MIKRITSLMAHLNIGTWLISDTEKKSAELFFIRKDEDMRREASVREISVTVYRDFDKDGNKMRGSAGVLLFDSMTDEEISQKLTRAYHAAQFVNNPYFDIAPCTVDKKLSGGDDPLSLMEKAEIMADALFMPDVNDEAFINSAEIFASLTHVRIYASNGTNVEYDSFRVKGEFVCQTLEPEDVEMYHAFEYAALDTFALSELSLDALSVVRDRAHAKNAPNAGIYDVILTKQHVYTLLSAYPEKANAALVFAKYSPYSVGMNVQGENIEGEKLNITLTPDEPFSFEGIPMPERTLISEGVLSSLHGATRFSRYLGIEPTGSYTNIRVDNGTKALEDMKKKPYLMPVSFSDFQMDPLSGHFSGEIRLAYLFDGERIHLVTGGSVNGSLLEKQTNLVFSLERYSDSSFSGPYAVLIPGVKVAGA